MHSSHTSRPRTQHTPHRTLDTSSLPRSEAMGHHPLESPFTLGVTTKGKDRRKVFNRLLRGAFPEPCATLVQTPSVAPFTPPAQGHFMFAFLLGSLRRRAQEPAQALRDKQRSGQDSNPGPPQPTPTTKSEPTLSHILDAHRLL